MSERDERHYVECEHCGRATYTDEPAPLTKAKELVNDQAKDYGLWFLAQTAAEAYLQQELRRLHAVIEQETLLG